MHRWMLGASAAVAARIVNGTSTRHVGSWIMTLPIGPRLSPSALRLRPYNKALSCTVQLTPVHWKKGRNRHSPVELLHLPSCLTVSWPRRFGSTRTDQLFAASATSAPDQRKAAFSVRGVTNSLGIVWVRFTWQLTDLDVDVRAPAGYRFRAARADELDDVIRVVLSAYASDPVWRPLLAGITDRMTKRIRATLGKAGSHYIAAEFNGDIVAVSGTARTHWTDQNLLTGICVAPEHQRKGLGRSLLAASLLRLRDFGLVTAKVYTEAGSLADRKIYPCFDSTREEGVDYPGLHPPPQDTENSS
jgi:GNAT superfamily N-acetyltransferase